MKRLSLLLVGVMVILQLVACGPAPPWPDEQPLAMYDEYEIESSDRGSVVQASILGIRDADGGIYIDVMFESDVLSTEELRRLAAGQSTRVSMSSGGAQYFDVMKENGKALPLLQWRHKQPTVPLFEMIDYGAPANRVLQSNDSMHRVVQVFVFRTTRDVYPGQYRVRMTDEWDSPRVDSLSTSINWQTLTID